VQAAGGAEFPIDMQGPSETLLVASAPVHLEHLNEALG
jgi:hypothetical protein